MAKANYIRHPNPMHRGNPLVEGLGFPLSKKQIHSQCGIPFVGGLDLSDVPEDLHGYYTRSSILNLLSMHVVQDEMVEIYEAIRLGIEVSYLGRNPLNDNWQGILAAIEADKDKPLQSINIKRLNLLENSYTFLITGLSGRGKSSMVKQALNQIEQVIEHTTYPMPDGTQQSCCLTQVTYLYVEHHDRVGQKAFLKAILGEIDALTGEKYSYVNRQASVYELIQIVRKAVIKHHIGTMVIDEAQNFALSPKDLKIGPNEKTSMRFVEELVNTLGVSTIFVGTFGALELFAKEMTITRRTLRAGSLMLACCDVESGFWKNLSYALFNSVRFVAPRDSDDALRYKLHALTAGIPAIAVSLVQAVLRFLSYFEASKQTLTVSVLDHVFVKQFAPLSGPIAALHHGGYREYEDLKPMRLLEMINPKDSKDDQGKLKVLEDTARELQESYEREKAKLLTGTVQLKPNKAPRTAHEVDATKESSALSPDNFLSMLGED
ncbi:ATP-binding protein [Shewanella acanthi]|uniref:ATP-binding protein n=1 Tax=Shewanella acanthi TaxID=2864212 RepID=UPI001C65A618|nr:ATP-binding protein [Shewanella acanthi]QYJ78352.1 ATP-binding protein [Shewanella acanthi]